MTARGQWILVAAIVAAVGAAVAGGVYVMRGELAQVTVGSTAPDIRGVSMDSTGATRTLADYKGQVTLINIWATWCVPCEKEMPMLQRIFEEYRPKGLRLVGVSIDVPGMEPEIRRFMSQYGITFDVIHDSNGRIKQDYMTAGVPESFIVGKDGVIRYKQIAAVNERDAAQIRALLDRLLSE
ncbi:MAG TPA: TlpA disulfide reductase family protein [Gemmatimonadaceae bacterium]|nr:TlpA disulfide reductase family protein [Gemmatimonadaceae bacterium]